MDLEENKKGRDGKGRQKQYLEWRLEIIDEVMVITVRV